MANNFPLPIPYSSFPSSTTSQIPWMTPRCNCSAFQKASYLEIGNTAQTSLIAHWCAWHQKGFVRPKDWSDYCTEQLLSGVPEQKE